MSERKKSAFTLIEIIIVIALILLVIGITSSIFITGNKVFSDSDVNTTLQIEGQKIQEKISDIAMQAELITSVDGDSTTGDITKISINSYDKYSKHEFIIEKENDKLMIDGNEISSNIQSVKINKDIIANTSNLEQFNTIEFNIMLSRNKGFSKITYPINFTITFRNK